MEGGIDADMFLKYDYAETKDLIKTFITLISATLVVSITFAEKIINFSVSTASERSMMVAAWGCFVAALIGSGASMCFIAAEAGCALYGQIPLLGCANGAFALASWSFILVSGAIYVSGLVLLLLSARHQMMMAPLRKDS